jgi:hypothetical protein
MKIVSQNSDALLVLRTEQKALLRPPDWEERKELQNRKLALVAVDLGRSDFVSTLFLQGCVELARRLASRTCQLALCNVSDHQRKVLGLVDGTELVAVLESKIDKLQEVAARLRSEQEPDEDDGVSRAEKAVLWS